MSNVRSTSLRQVRERDLVAATRTLFDGFSAVYTEGQDDAAEEAERTLPPLILVILRIATSPCS